MIQQAPWWAVSAEVECPQCRCLLDRGTVLAKSTRLHASMDGYAIYSFSCPLNDCGWSSGEILVKIDMGASAVTAPEVFADPGPAPTVVMPTAEEVERLTKPEAPLKSASIILPEPEPVDVKELEMHVIKNSPNDIKLRDGRVLRRKISKQELAATTDTNTGVVRLIYSEGNARTDQFQFYQGEKTFMTTGGLPDMKNVMDEIMQAVDADLKLQNPHPQRVTQRPVFNRQRSRLRGICGCESPDHGHGIPCGDMTGECGCSRPLRNVGSPGGMGAPQSLLVAPDGARIPTLQQRLESGEQWR